MNVKKRRPQKPTSLEHIVPAFYLKNFCDAAGTLYVYEQGKEIKESIPRRVCAEHQFYEFNFSGIKSRNLYENWLKRIETDGSDILPLLCERKILSNLQAAAWACFVASLFIRTRKVRSQISTAMVRKMREHANNVDFIRELQHELLKRGEMHFASDLTEYCNQFQAEMDKSPSFYHVLGLPQHTRSLADALLRMKWQTILSPAGQFVITSDARVVTIQRHASEWRAGAGFAKENVIVLLPLTRDKVFAASADFISKKEVEPVYIDNINRLVIRFAHRTVYADRRSSGLKSLVDGEINQVVFGKNAFLP